MFSLIQRRLVIDLIKTATLCLAGISMLLMLVVTMIQVARTGLDPAAAFFIMPFLVPPLMAYTVPTCLLFACTVVYGGLARTNEIVAIKSMGIHAGRIIGPVVVLAAVVGGLNIYMANTAIPACNVAFRDAIYRDLQGTIYSYLRQRGAIAEPGLPYELYVRAVHGDKLIDPIIKQRNDKGGYDMVAQASEAKLEVGRNSDGEPALVINLLNGVVATDLENSVHFRERREEMPLPASLTEPQVNAAILDFVGLQKQAEKFRIEAEEKKLEFQQLDAEKTGDPGAVESLQHEITWLERKAREFDAEVHVRLAQATATLPFVLLGCPISIRYHRRDFLQAFFICYIPIILLFYPSMILVFNVVKETSTVSPLYLWAPSLLITLFSLPFLRLVCRY